MVGLQAMAGLQAICREIMGCDEKNGSVEIEPLPSSLVLNLLDLTINKHVDLANKNTYFTQQG